MVSHRDLDAAHKTALALHAQSRGKVRCHGDFMNKNILLDARATGGRSTRARIADRCLDAASGPYSPTRRAREARCELVARTARLDADRVWAWALVFAVSEAALATTSRARMRTTGYWAVDRTNTKSHPNEPASYLCQPTRSSRYPRHRRVRARSGAPRGRPRTTMSMSAFARPGSSPLSAERSVLRRRGRVTGPLTGAGRAGVDP